MRAAIWAGAAAGVVDAHLKAAADQLYFGVLSDWGGQTDVPYTTAGQVCPALAALRPCMILDRR
jgi:hypothetical protein